jgi:hypothetical protein
LKDGAQLTTNSVESWHNVFRTMVGADHVDIWRMIEAFDEDEVIARHRSEREDAGMPFPESSVKTQQKMERLRTVLNRYESGTFSLMQFIRGTAQSLYLGRGAEEDI